MKAIEFEGVNVRIAEDQPEYQTLPARIGPVPLMEGHDAMGATFCFELTPEELAEVNRTGRIWHTVVTFGQPLQPQSMTVEKPPFI